MAKEYIASVWMTFNGRVMRPAASSAAAHAPGAQPTFSPACSSS
jgi:hypothetical protein